MSKKRRTLVSIIALVLIGAMLLGLVAAGITAVFAADSDDIKSEISQLEDEAADIAAKRQELQSEIDSTSEEAKSIAQKKSEIDRSVELTRLEVNNLEAQIKEYNRLISEKQTELDGLLADEADLNARYKTRLRAMEENGTAVSYWEILFGASSFSELVDRIELIQEIENSDRLMLQNLKEAAALVSRSRETLAAQKVTLSEKRAELASAEDALMAQREEADKMVQELNASLKDMRDVEEEYEAKEDALVAAIAAKEKEYQSAVALEAEKRRQEEEQRRREEEERRQQEAEEDDDDDDDDDDDSYDSDSSSSSSSSGSYDSYTSWCYPLPAGTSYVTCGYGWRIHPVTGNESFHTGVDLGAGQGTPIYATRSGYVTEAAYGEIYGNYVTINHGDGFSSLYGHMIYSTVNYGDWVDWGEVIGYVGSTGWSTGPHLHFTIYYGGGHVNPMNYVSVR